MPFIHLYVDVYRSRIFLFIYAILLFTYILFLSSFYRRHHFFPTHFLLLHLNFKIPSWNLISAVYTRSVPHSCFIQYGTRVRFSLIFSLFDCSLQERSLSGGSIRLHIRDNLKSHNFNNERISNASVFRDGSTSCTDGPG